MSLKDAAVVEKAVPRAPRKLRNDLRRGAPERERHPSQRLELEPPVIAATDAVDHLHVHTGRGRDFYAADPRGPEKLQ